jgi:hypothetical protein
VVEEIEELAARLDFRVMSDVSESWNPVSKSSPELLEG